MDKCPYLVVIIQRYGKQEADEKEKYTVAPAEENMSLLNEPEYTYGNHAAAAPRPMVLMGMNSKAEYTEVHNENDYISVIRNGIPRRAMTQLMAIADLSLLEMAAITHTSDRTLRRYGPQQKLSQEQSERMVELAKLYSRGEDVLGSLDNFRQWMDTVLLPFGNKKPKEFLDTSIGINMIMDELGRIKYGIFA